MSRRKHAQPTVEIAKRVSKQRLAPMIEATPALRKRVAESRSRDSGNTVQVKEFEGGLLIITGANSGAGLRSTPIRFLFMDGRNWPVFPYRESGPLSHLLGRVDPRTFASQSTPGRAGGARD